MFRHRHEIAALAWLCSSFLDAAGVPLKPDKHFRKTEMTAWLPQGQLCQIALPGTPGLDSRTCGLIFLRTQRARRLRATCDHGDHRCPSVLLSQNATGQCWIMAGGPFFWKLRVYGRLEVPEGPSVEFSSDMGGERPRRWNSIL